MRNLLKEHLQLYILNFIYSSPIYSKLIFTGGTCLRRFYDLPRLSEDLDFDFEKSFKFNAEKFSGDIMDYFKKQLQFREIETKWSKRENILFLRFPILDKIGFAGRGESNILFVRCDFSPNNCSKFGLENRLLAAGGFTFIARGYDLPTLLANKIAAFLNRDFRRDIFDLSWFVSLSRKQNWGLKANWERVSVLTGIKFKNKLVEAIEEKLEKIEKKSLASDLSPFMTDQVFVENFSQNFQKFIVPYLKEVV